jgi:hypothetical protein
MIMTKIIGVEPKGQVVHAKAVKAKGKKNHQTTKNSQT